MLFNLTAYSHLLKVLHTAHTRRNIAHHKAAAMFHKTSLALLGLSFCALAQTTKPIVDLGYAIYQGSFNQTSNTTDFLGVRFAAPPVGTSYWGTLTHLKQSYRS